MNELGLDICEDLSNYRDKYGRKEKIGTPPGVGRPNNQLMLGGLGTPRAAADQFWDLLQEISLKDILKRNFRNCFELSRTTQ